MLLLCILFNLACFFNKFNSSKKAIGATKHNTNHDNQVVAATPPPSNIRPSSSSTKKPTSITTRQNSAALAYKFNSVSDINFNFYSQQ